MGKTGGVTTAMKKRGRPSLIELQRAALRKRQELLQNHNCRYTCRNPSSATEYVSNYEEEYHNDDDDEREEKKVKFVVRLPQLDQQSDLVRFSTLNSVSCGSDSNADVNNRKNISGSGGIITHSQGEKVMKEIDTSLGLNTWARSSMEAEPTTTPLPDMKLLVFILDRLQMKDTHAVFSEPVNLDKFPDYDKIVKQPMDFGTLRSKLDTGRYSNLEQLEADVYLICSNAMLYNPSGTIYFRQANSIQKLAKRDFENLRQKGDDGELQPKLVKRGRPPNKHLKKPLDSTSGATIANATIANVIDSTNKNYADNVLPSNCTRNGDQRSELLTDWNEEFPARIKMDEMKYWGKRDIIDESRRDTYKQFHPLNFAHENSLQTNFGGERKQLLTVALHADPEAPGVVGEPEASPLTTSAFPAGKVNYEFTPRLTSDDILIKPEAPSTSGPKVEEYEVKTNNLAPQNGFNGALGSNLSKMEMYQAYGQQPIHSTIVEAQGTKGEDVWPVIKDRPKSLSFEGVMSNKRKATLGQDVFQEPIKVEDDNQNPNPRQFEFLFREDPIRCPPGRANANSQRNSNSSDATSRLSSKKARQLVEDHANATKRTMEMIAKESETRTMLQILRFLCEPVSTQMPREQYELVMKAKAKLQKKYAKAFDSSDDEE